MIPQRAAFIDGPFRVAQINPLDQPWLLSNQRKLGIAIQSDGRDGYFSQPHGYLRGRNVSKVDVSETGALGTSIADVMEKHKKKRSSKQDIRSRLRRIGQQELEDRS
jgi:hypothetical protein